MPLSFSRLSWLWSGGKAKDEASNGSANSLGEPGFGVRRNLESLSSYSKKKVKDDGDEKRSLLSNPNRKISKNEERIVVDKDHDDAVLVPSESDWSIGWLEPHAPSFHSDDSFAVLVPCYRHSCLEFEDKGGNRNSINSEGGREYMERWLSSIQKF